MRWLRILSTYEFDIQHRAGTKHGNADSLSLALHAPFFSKPEAQEVLADNQILLLGEALLDDGQESEEDCESLSESGDESDPRIPAESEFPAPQGPDSETVAEKQCSDPILAKVAQWLKRQHQPSLQEYKMLTPDEKFYVDCFEYLQLTSSSLLIQKPIPFTNEKDSRIILPEKLWNKVFSSFHS